MSRLFVKTEEMYLKNVLKLRATLTTSFDSFY